MLQLIQFVQNPLHVKILLSVNRLQRFISPHLHALPPRLISLLRHAVAFHFPAFLRFQCLRDANQFQSVACLRFALPVLVLTKLFPCRSIRFIAFPAPFFSHQCPRDSTLFCSTHCISFANRGFSELNSSVPLRFHACLLRLTLPMLLCANHCRSFAMPPSPRHAQAAQPKPSFAFAFIPSQIHAMPLPGPSMPCNSPAKLLLAFLILCFAA